MIHGRSQGEQFQIYIFVPKLAGAFLKISKSKRNCLTFVNFKIELSMFLERNEMKKAEKKVLIIAGVAIAIVFAVNAVMGIKFFRTQNEHCFIHS